MPSLLWFGHLSLVSATITMHPASLAIYLQLFFVFSTSAIEIGIIPYFENNHDDIFKSIEFLVNISEVNKICKNHTQLYLKELRTFRLWATEMFDSSSKFDTGALYGSVYDLGNYDQCIKIKVPPEIGGFGGKPCLAKFTVEPPENYTEKEIDFLDDYQKYYNVSVLDKIFNKLNDPSKIPRNEFYFTYCIPSSCTNKDLQEIFQKILMVNSNSNLTIKVDVPERSCQLSKEFMFDGKDWAFIAFLITLLMVVIVATFYDWINELKGAGDKNYHSSTSIQILLCFSFIRNLRRLVSVKEDSDGFTCISGIKSITMALFILGHGMMFMLSAPIVNPPFVEMIYRRFSAAILLNGPIVVDTFFLISGFFTSYFMLSKLRETKRGINIFLIYLHRILRLTPSYLVVLMFYCTIFSKTGDGILWDQRILVEQERCLHSWWANLLMINNYVNTDHICMFQSWYLACDSQLFFLAVPLIWCLWKNRRLTLIFISCFTVFAMILVFTTVFLTEEKPILLLYVQFLKDPVLNSTYKTIYIPTHLRFTPYLIGILGGYLRYKIRRENYQFSNRMSILGWFICGLTMVLTIHTGFIFYTREVLESRIVTSLYSSLYHLTWSISVAWLIIAISCGRGVYLNAILSWMPHIMLSRLTYSAFLIHGAIQMYLTSSLRTPLHMGYIDSAFYLLGQIFITFFLGWLLTMFVEAPVSALEKILLKSHLAKHNTESKENLDHSQDNGTKSKF